MLVKVTTMAASPLPGDTRGPFLARMLFSLQPMMDRDGLSVLVLPIRCGANMPCTPRPDTCPLLPTLRQPSTRGSGRDER